MSHYNNIAGLVSKIRNARYGEMVNYIETLIDSGDWRDFTTPAGTRFRFRECEFDYFLLTMEVDPTLVRHASCMRLMWTVWRPSRFDWLISRVVGRRPMNVGGVIGGRWLTTWTLTHRVLRHGFGLPKTRKVVGSLPVVRAS